MDIQTTMMDIQTTWDYIMSELKADTPKAVFETWVRGARLAGVEDGAAIVEARSQEVCEWLESRLEAHIRSQLRPCGVQEVRFVVGEAEAAKEDAEEEAAAEEEIEVTAETGSLYEQAVRPERAVYLQGYFRRWLKVLGPDLGWFYVGFRQAAYWAGGRGGQKSGRFAGKQIARLCGITERTFWNRVKSEAAWRKLDGLVRAQGQESRESGERQRRRYAVAMSLPLTAADVRALTRWLTDHLEACGGAQGALDAACQTPVAELLADDPAAEAEGFSPMTITQLLRQMFPDEDLKGQAERLRMHLMPQRDQIVVSLFFLEHILPWLGAGAAWVYVLLRDRCYVNAQGHERDMALVRGGYREMAGWLGSGRPQTVYDWLREPIARVYLSCERSGEGNGKWDNPLTVRVLLNDVPAEIVQAAAQGDSNAIFSQGTLGVTQFSESGNAIFISPVTQFSESGNAIFIPPVTQFSEFGNAIFSTLKLLNTGIKPINPGGTDQPAPESEKSVAHPAAESVGWAGKDGWDLWDFERLLERLEVNPSSRRRLREANVPVQSFMAWLLQAMTMKNVDAVRIAVSWSLDARKRDAARRDFKLLAASPGELRQMARLAAGGLLREGRALRGGGEAAAAYRRVFGEDARKADAILSLLFGE
jgi:hypothetical protein